MPYYVLTDNGWVDLAPACGTCGQVPENKQYDCVACGSIQKRKMKWGALAAILVTGMTWGIGCWYWGPIWTVRGRTTYPDVEMVIGGADG